MRRRETDKEKRKEELMQAALTLAKSIGFNQVNRCYLGIAAKVSPGLISFHFQSTKKLREEILKRAIKDEIYIIIAQAITLNHKLTKNLPVSMRTKTFQYLNDQV